jgi:exosortase
MMHSLSDTGKSRAVTRRQPRHQLYLLVGACVLVVVSFSGPFAWMLNQWFVVEEYSPGPAVPILSAIALWHMLKKREALPRISRRAAKWCIGSAAFLAGIVYLGREHPRLLLAGGVLSSLSYTILFAAMTFSLLSSGFLLDRLASGSDKRRTGLFALVLLLLSLGVHFLALRGDFPRASIVAYVSLLFCMSWYLHGWMTARALAFPYLILILMVPLEFIDEIVGVPLRLMATDAAVFLMRLVGLQVEQVGNWFTVGSMEFMVDAPCSGLKSLIALLALGATFAYVTQPTVLKKVLLAACAVPIALVTNILRLACVGISAEFFGRDFAVSVFHDHAAVFLYIFAILIFISLDKRVFQAKWFRVRNF